MRKEFLQINAQLKDLKSIEKELVKVEILQVGLYRNIWVIGIRYIMLKAVRLYLHTFSTAIFILYYI